MDNTCPTTISTIHALHESLHNALRTHLHQRPADEQPSQQSVATMHTVIDNLYDQLAQSVRAGNLLVAPQTQQKLKRFIEMSYAKMAHDSERERDNPLEKEALDIGLAELERHLIASPDLLPLAEQSPGTTVIASSARIPTPHALKTKPEFTPQIRLTHRIHPGFVSASSAAKTPSNIGVLPSRRKIIEAWDKGDTPRDPIDGSTQLTFGEFSLRVFCITSGNKYPTVLIAEDSIDVYNQWIRELRAAHPEVLRSYGGSGRSRESYGFEGGARFPSR